MKIDRIQRIQNTRYGNPQLVVASGERTWLTEPDSDAGHRLLAYVDRLPAHLVLTVNENNRVTGFKEMKK